MKGDTIVLLLLLTFMYLLEHCVLNLFAEKPVLLWCCENGITPTRKQTEYLP